MAFSVRLTLRCMALPDNPKAVFLYYGIADEVQDELIAAGYQIVRSPRKQLHMYANPVDALLRGGVTALVMGKIQMRDLMHGAMLTCTRGGHVTDWRGNDYLWPQKGGELPRVAVSGWPLPDNLKGILARAAAQYAT